MYEQDVSLIYYSHLFTLIEDGQQIIQGYVWML